jgi:hypothetical protein
VSTPEEALERARSEAAARRERGEDLDVSGGFEVRTADRVSSSQLLEWAVLEPDASHVYSTRRLGAPITWAKRLLVRGLRQYLVQLVDQQTRFNLQVAQFVADLDERVTRLEEQDRDRPPAP